MDWAAESRREISIAVFCLGERDEKIRLTLDRMLRADSWIQELKGLAQFK